MLAKKLSGLALSVEEYVLLKAVVLLNPGHWLPHIKQLHHELINEFMLHVKQLVMYSRHFSETDYNETWVSTRDGQTSDPAIRIRPDFHYPAKSDSGRI